MKILIKIILVTFTFVFNSLSAQNFLNGDFETNTATICQINIANASFNSFMSDCTAYGPGNEIDIQDAICVYGTPNSGNWFISLATSIVGIPDALSLTLSTPLTTGNNYTFCYYEEADTAFTGLDSIEIGLSTSPTNFGTLIFSSQPVVGVWTYRFVNFTAPNNGNYITIRNKAQNTGWNFIDNFSFNGCNPITIVQPYLEMPNIFTPNNDGLNDYFRPIKISDIDVANLIIYNRWGQKLFESNNIQNGWDGKYNNENCSDGTYFWIVKYTGASNNSIAIKGFVTLVE